MGSILLKSECETISYHKAKQLKPIHVPEDAENSPPDGWFECLPIMQDFENNLPPAAPKKEYRNTIGSIVAWAIFRTALVMVAAMALYEYARWIDYNLWWGLTIISLYAVVIHPLQIQYRLYKEETEKVMTGTLCASCKYFERTGVMCTKLDEHVTEEYIPCEGQMWEPQSPMDDDDEF